MSEGSSAANPAWPPQSILVVDDDPEVCELVREMLMGRGYDVLTALSGEEALRVCREHAGPIHLLLSDVVMPGMNGSEVARRIKVLRPDIRLLLISGVVQESAIPGGLPRNARFLSKPFTWNALIQTLHTVLPAE
jgi:two-component system, cell cycle sensor histidine kinase and response regulator CckA